MAFVVELPGGYVDALTSDSVATARPALINRDPEPSEINIAVGTNIQLDLTDIGANGIDLAATFVYVNGILAFSAGAFLTGFTGPASAHSTPQADTRRIIIDPTTSFNPEQVVTVRVVSNVVGGGFAFDQSYTFTVEDTSPPVLVDVSALGLRRVRVQFDDPVTQLDPTAPGDALYKASYALTPQAVPSVTPTVIEVRTVDVDIVDLITDIDLTPGITYRLTVTLVENENGYAISTGNILDFTSYLPQQPDGREFDLYKLMPDVNRLEDQGGLKRFMSCLQEVSDISLALIDTFTSIVSADDSSEAYLDLILADLSNPFTFMNLTEVDRRRLAKVLVELYKQKGTELGIVNAIRLLVGAEATVAQYDGLTMFLGLDELNGSFILAPSLSFVRRAFNLSFSVALTPEKRTQIRRITKIMKPANTHLVKIIDPGQTAEDQSLLGSGRLGDVPTITMGSGNGTLVLYE